MAQQYDAIVIGAGVSGLYALHKLRELDDGVTRRARAGDCVVQNGTRRAWRNSGSIECVAVAVVIGARASAR
jgi:hypothetical protein